MPVSYQPPRSWRRLVSWAAHKAVWIWLVALIADVTSEATGSPWRVVAAAVAMLLLLGVLWAQRRHDNRLCARCVAATPLDPQRDLLQRRRTLRLWHQMHTGYVSQVILLAGITAGLAIPLFLHSWPNAFDWLCAWGSVATYTSLVHRPREPWCPYCRRWDEGGDPEPAPNPAPPPGATIHT